MNTTTAPVPTAARPQVSPLAATAGEELTPQQLEQAQTLRELSKTAVTGEQARLDLGRRLLQIRPTWPKSGHKAVGWKMFLDAASIEKRTAQRYMRAANADKIRDTVSQKQKLTVLERVRKLLLRLTLDEKARLRRDLDTASPVA